MTKRKKKRQASGFEMTQDNLKKLDQSTLVDLLLNLYEQNKQLSEIPQSMVREKHGPKTERLINPDQLNLFEKEEAANSTSQNQESNDEPYSSTDTNQKPTKLKKNGHTRQPMPAHLEQIPIKGRELSEAEPNCQCCSKTRIKTNEFIRNSRIEFKPSQIFIQDFIESIYSCPDCGDTLIVKPEIVQSIENGTAGPALQAEIIVSKYEDHMPLYRQEQRFARLRAPIARSTMVGWLNNASITLRPLYDRMRKLLLRSRVIATDDTPVKVQDRKKSKNVKIGRMWIYRGDGQHPVNIFDYTQGRGRAGPQIFLDGFKGYLQGDCFSGNTALCAATGATLIACRAHDRRYYIKAQPNNKAACNEMLQMYSDLFEIDRTARELNLNANEIKIMRQQEALPIIEKMKEWLDKHIITALPQSSFGKAVRYSLNNWTELNNYLLDGDLRIDNNLAEQEMKRVAIGKKNWLFFGSDNGGERAEVLMSLTSTCKRHDINPTDYLKDVIQKLSENPYQDLDPLLPHNWKHQIQNPELEPNSPTPKISCA